MSDYSKMKRGPEMTGWLRAPAAEAFTKQLAARRDVALANLLGAASVSSDPKVTKAHAVWGELETLTTYLQNARRESEGDD